MTYARFYFERHNRVNTPDTATLSAPTGWTWAMVRGIYNDRTPIKKIDFTGKSGLATLTIPLTTQPSLAKSIYEVVLGMSDEIPSDPKFNKAQQPHIWDQAIKLSKACMDEDPPPPPELSGSFAVVSIK